VGSRLSSPGPQQRRFAAYIEGLANAAGHADRRTPLKNYCTGLLLPGERKSVEPMAARLAPNNVRRMHQSLHHFVADAPWIDEEMLAQVRQEVLPTMQKHGPVVAWIVDDTGFPKQGKHSGPRRLALALLRLPERSRYSPNDLSIASGCHSRLIAVS
jgi:SRSO17 transposase